MATQTYDLLESKTLSSATSSVTFLSIDQTYVDLVLIIYAKRSSAGDITLRYNSDSDNNYRTINMLSDGSSTTANNIGRNHILLSPGSTTTAIVTANIINYTATGQKTETLGRSDDGTNKTVASVSQWADSPYVAINTIKIDGGSNFDAGSTFSLYGIAG